MIWRLFIGNHRPVPENGQVQKVPRSDQKMSRSHQKIKPLPKKNLVNVFIAATCGPESAHRCDGAHSCPGYYFFLPAKTPVATATKYFSATCPPDRECPAGTIGVLSRGNLTATEPGVVPEIRLIFFYRPGPLLDAPAGIIPVTASGEKRTFTVESAMPGRLSRNPGFSLGRTEWQDRGSAWVIKRQSRSYTSFF